MIKIIEKDIDELIPYENNARINDNAIDIVANSIQEFGFKNPCIIDSNNVLVAGHTRVEACKKLGIKKVPCIVADDLTEKQIKAFRIADNSSAQVAEWDMDKLMAELETIDYDMSKYGLAEQMAEIEKIIEENKEVEEDDFDAELPEEPKAKLGDIYKLGNHRLMCGDSTDVLNINILMNSKKADMVLSDPPYGMYLDTDFSSCLGSLGSLGRKHNTRGNKYEKVIGDNDDFKPELINTFFDNFDYCKEMFLFGADYFAEILPNKNNGSWLVWDKRKESQADAIGSEFELIWSKNKHKRRMLRHDWFGFLSSQNQKDARNRVHPTQKPITLLTDILNQWGKDCNVIVDLYGGSGSTLIACEQLNKQCYMMELDPKYVDVIINRWEQFTGKKAELIKGE